MNNNDLVKRLGCIPSPWDSKRLNYIVRQPTIREVEALPLEYRELTVYHAVDWYDQNDVGSCTGWGAKIYRDMLRRVMGEVVDGNKLSAGWLYVKGREEANIMDDSQDGGTCLGVLKALNHYGALKEEYYPTDVSSPFNYNQSEPDEWEALAEPYAVDAYYQVPNNPDAMMSAMYGVTHEMPYRMPDGSRGKTPLYVAIPIYSSIQQAVNGYVPNPVSWWEQPVGYHATVFDEWFVRDGVKYWGCANSWGKDNGDGGRNYFRCDYPVVEAWIIHLGKPIKPKSWWERFLDWFWGLFG